MGDTWEPDILGGRFEQITLPLGTDNEGDIVATVVCSIPPWWQSLLAPLADVDVLYVHGWADYFFQTELAAAWNRLGARFYALDLRKYGRSLRKGQTPGYIASLDEYDADIAAALTEIGHGKDAASSRRLFLMGHSTGGLILTLWAARHRGVADALVLNSPWLEFQLGAVGRQALAPLVEVRARFDPLGAHPAVDLGYYTRAQKEIGSLPTAGTHERWRPERGFPTHPGWLAAIIAGHATIAGGVDVGCPAFVLLSQRSSNPFAWSEEATSTDSVLVVDDIARAATKLGPLVTIARIDGAIHDVFLSRSKPRAAAYAALGGWLRGL